MSFTRLSKIKTFTNAILSHLLIYMLNFIVGQLPDIKQKVNIHFIDIFIYINVK